MLRSVLFTAALCAPGVAEAVQEQPHKRFARETAEDREKAEDLIVSAEAFIVATRELVAAILRHPTCEVHVHRPTKNVFVVPAGGGGNLPEGFEKVDKGAFLVRCIQDQEEAAHDAAMARLARSFFHHHSQPSATPGPGSKPVSAMTNDELLMSMANDDYAVREAGHVELLRRVMSKDPLTVAKAILSIAEALKSPDAELVARGRNIRFEIHQHGAHNLFSCLRKRLKMGGLDKGETNLITETLSVLKSNDIEGFFVPDDLPE